MGLDEGLRRLRLVLLVTLEEEAEVERQPARATQPGLGRLEVHEELALVIARSARIQDVVLVARLERRPYPLVQRVGRLDVVVAVDERGRGVGTGVQPIGGHDRVAAGIGDGDVLGADAGQLVGDPLRRPSHVVTTGRIGTDRGDAQELVEAGEVLVGVLAQVGEGGVNAAFSGCHWPIIRR